MKTLRTGAKRKLTFKEPDEASDSILYDEETQKESPSKKRIRIVLLLNANKPTEKYNNEIFPLEILTFIFSFLDPIPNLLITRGVCKFWKKVSDLPQLWKTFHFYYCKVTNDNLIEFASRYSRSEKFLMKGCKQITHFGLQEFFKKGGSNLHTIFIQDCAKNPFYIISNSCPNLQNLFLPHMGNFSPNDLLYLLQKCTQIEYLDLSDSFSVNDKTISLLLLYCTQLKGINLINTSITRKVISILQQFPCLEELEFKLPSSISSSTDSLGFPNLKKLRIFQTPLSDEAMEQFLISSDLEALELNFCLNLEGTFFQYFQNFSSLKYLSIFSSSRIKDKLLEEFIPKFTNLTSLDSGSSQISEKTLLHTLSQCSKLIDLNLSGSRNLDLRRVRKPFRELFPVHVKFPSRRYYLSK